LTRSPHRSWDSIVYQFETAQEKAVYSRHSRYAVYVSAPLEGGHGLILAKTWRSKASGHFWNALVKYR
jgi:hypothetical protein